MELADRRQRAGAGWRGRALLRRGVPAQVRLRAHSCAHRGEVDRRDARCCRDAGDRLAVAQPQAGLCAGDAWWWSGTALSHSVRRVSPVRPDSGRGGVLRARRHRSPLGRTRGATERIVDSGSGRLRRLPGPGARVNRGWQPCDAVQLLRRAQRRCSGHCTVPGVASAQRTRICLHFRYRRGLGRALLPAGTVREYGAAWSAVAVSAIYLVLASVLYRRHAETLRMLVEAFLALGVIFATLAIPLAFDGRWTSAAWALEGAAAYWVGVKQGRRLPRAFGLLLQF